MKKDKKVNEEWYQAIVSNIRRKKLPILLPAKEDIKATLVFEDGVPMRNLDYMERFLKRFPTFVWLSRYPLSQEDID